MKELDRKHHEIQQQLFLYRVALMVGDYNTCDEANEKLKELLN